MQLETLFVLKSGQALQQLFTYMELMLAGYTKQWILNIEYVFVCNVTYHIWSWRGVSLQVL